VIFNLSCSDEVRSNGIKLGSCSIMTVPGRRFGMVVFGGYASSPFSQRKSK